MQSPTRKFNPIYEESKTVSDLLNNLPKQNLPKAGIKQLHFNI